VTSTSTDPLLAAAVLEGLPVATVLVDGALRVVHANALARAVLHAKPGDALDDALGCAPDAPARGAATIRDAVARALAGERVRARAFLLRTGAHGEPADLHLLACASPLDVGGVRHAVLVVDDADRILLDPSVVRICAGCGRVEDEDGGWHPLHVYLEDRLGLASDELCGACARDGG
jgi:hypothetical protein